MVKLVKDCDFEGLAPVAKKWAADKNCQRLIELRFVSTLFPFPYQASNSNFRYA